MTARKIVSAMMEKDLFSQWLGIQVLNVEKGSCLLSMKVRSEMLNGFSIAHGGITYSLADSALAFASNSFGRQSLSIETSIAHITSVKEGEELFAEAIVTSDSNKLGHYDVRVWTSDPRKPVALFKGMVYKTSRDWQV
jgi:acyl-CoA thioesterase